MGTYETERWSEPPVEMMQMVLLRKLRNSGRYRDVNTLRSGARGDYLLRGRLYDFKEVSGKSFVARLSFDLELHETKTNGTVWTSLTAMTSQSAARTFLPSSQLWIATFSVRAGECCQAHSINIFTGAHRRNESYSASALFTRIRR